MKLSLLAPILIVLPVVVIACSSAAPTSKLDPTAQYVALQSDELAQMCDWIASRFGGYGARKSCDGVFIEAAPSQDECVAGAQTLSKDCAATVGDFEVFIRSFTSCDPEPGYAQATTRIAACGKGGTTDPAGSGTEPVERAFSSVRFARQR